MIAGIIFGGFLAAAFGVAVGVSCWWAGLLFSVFLFMCITGVMLDARERGVFK